MNNISKIDENCVGCRSCEQTCPVDCISMILNSEGFLYPSIDEEKCIECGKCLKNCPVHNEKVYRNKPKETWAWHNKCHEDIMRSASGGASDVAAKAIIEKNGVVFGAAYDENLDVKHIEICEEKYRYKIQSSKYVQSDINDSYSKAKGYLEKNVVVLFTGTPCQIAGLYSYLGKDYPNLYTIDLVCHGVPSPLFFRKYIEYQNKKNKEPIISYNFRSKDKRGWGTQYLLKTKTKTKTKTLALDKYGKHFMDGDCYRECCYKCDYANINRVADITVGDFWGILKNHPEFYYEDGVSSVFINTEKGEKLFNHMKKYADVKLVTLEDGLIKQGNLVQPSSRPFSRDTFYKNINKEDFVNKLIVGLQIKNRIKSLIPQIICIKIKKIIG